MLTLGFVTGSEPDKWLRRFTETTAHGGIRGRGLPDPLGELLRGELDLAIVRLPDERVDDRFHVISLYDEEIGIGVPKDSVYAEVGEEVNREDVVDEIVNYRPSVNGSVNITELAEALHIVAANVGVAIAPRPALKVLSKKQVKHLPFTDPSLPRTSIALVFEKGKDSDVIQDFVGIAKGRTANSSRQAAPKRTAKEKAKAKQARRQQAKGATNSRRKSLSRRKKRR